MTMLSATLKSNLLAMGLFDNEPDAIAAWAGAFKTYFSSASAGPVPVVAAALTSPEAAMKGAMVGLSTGGAAVLQAGILAFWGALNPVATYFPAGLTITPPVGLAGLAASLGAVFAANVVGAKSAVDSYDAIAAAIHAANAGGIVAFPIPPAGIGPQTIL